MASGGVLHSSQARPSSPRCGHEGTIRAIEDILGADSRLQSQQVRHRKVYPRFLAYFLSEDSTLTTAKASKSSYSQLSSPSRILTPRTIIRGPKTPLLHPLTPRPSLSLHFSISAPAASLMRPHLALRHQHPQWCRHGRLHASVSSGSQSCTCCARSKARERPTNSRSVTRARRRTGRSLHSGCCRYVFVMHAHETACLTFCVRTTQDEAMLFITVRSASAASVPKVLRVVEETKRLRYKSGELASTAMWYGKCIF